MSKLAEFLKTHSLTANPANSAIPYRDISNFSDFSSEGREDLRLPHDAESRTRVELDDRVHSLSPAQEAARQDVLAQLAANPIVKRSFTTRFENGDLIVTLAIRGIGTCELKIPAERFNRESLDDYAALVACFNCEGNA
jgi:hypothetical protein